VDGAGVCASAGSVRAIVAASNSRRSHDSEREFGGVMVMEGNRRLEWV
jgi:hypothetical protein